MKKKGTKEKNIKIAAAKQIQRINNKKKIALKKKNKTRKDEIKFVNIYKEIVFEWFNRKVFLLYMGNRFLFLSDQQRMFENGSHIALSLYWCVSFE